MIRNRSNLVAASALALAVTGAGNATVLTAGSEKLSATVATAQADPPGMKCHISQITHKRICIPKFDPLAGALCEAGVCNRNGGLMTTPVGPGWNNRPPSIFMRTTGSASNGR
jgi:hypothetical protein